VKRRTFIAGLGSVAAWPLAVRAQQGDRVRRIGVLISRDETDPEGKRRYSAFTQALTDLGWSNGRNVRMDFRWGGGDLKVPLIFRGNGVIKESWMRRFFAKRTRNEHQMEISA